MFDHVAYEFNDEQTNGHPHDLLARLYREIGISAVAAALEASKPLNEKAPERETLTRDLTTRDLAA